MLYFVRMQAARDTVLINSTAAIVKATTAVISSGLLNVTASR